MRILPGLSTQAARMVIRFSSSCVVMRGPRPVCTEANFLSFLSFTSLCYVSLLQSALAHHVIPSVSYSYL